ncbi:MAG TPA: exopolysaccharide biosynthesis protein [Vitreimonas sp.]|uniref:exopolysaccharide biosynthesis protein n=1 Tax=Vitreimonas sp. TaxID=3069702 RepID=UPI002D270C7F|nr:exopolysaccharide biosynthesis protein [Vitreimonas sp.]HYD87176.1 exopolysaccharide biosynthesis protein [Vitreimonas sp.]
MARRRSEVHNLTSLLDALQHKIDDDRRNGNGGGDVQLRDVLEVIGRRAYGPLLLIIGLISVSPATLIPGSTWLFAVVTLLIAIQLTFHKQTPWLPRKALDMKLSEEKLGQFLQASRPTARAVDTVVRPRLQFLTKPPWVIVVALLCVLAALITFPLGLIPIAPLLPGLAITFFGLGLTARDGVLLTIGAGVMGGAFWLLFTRLF